jgi:hypothetical protein
MAVSQGGRCWLHTVNLFFDRPDGPAAILEGPGRVKSREFPPPTFLEPSLIELEVDVNGSGAATLESFYNDGSSISLGRRRLHGHTYLLTFFAHHSREER